MSNLLVGWLTSIPVGAAAAVLIGTVRRHLANRCVVTEMEKVEIAKELTDHAAFMSQQVNAYADHLAGDDLLLRERLRAFQSGAS